MSMRLRPILALSVSLAWLPSLGFTLGLGGIELKSGLNEPMQAEIKLLQMRDLSSEEVLASLAGPDDFERAGVAREFFLTDLRFDVKTRADGTAVVLVTSRKPVREPYLNFLIEVLWPSGRLLREYTLLMDPPVYTERVAERINGPSSTPAPASSSLSTPTAPSNANANAKGSARASTTTVKPAAPGQSTQSTPPSRRAESVKTAQADRDFAAAAPDTYKVKQNDVLWNVATLMRPASDVTIPQMMLAIQRNNPDAFIDNNINLLKRGHVLRAPTSNDVRTLTRQEAVAEVSRQERLWRQRLAARKGDLESRSVDKPVISDAKPSRMSAPEEEVSGVLTLASGMNAAATESSSGAGGSGSAGSQGGLPSEEYNNELDRIRSERQEAESRIADLESLISSNNSIITLQNDQIARLRERLKELEQQADLRASSGALPEPMAPDSTTPATGVEKGNEPAGASAVDSMAQDDALSQHTPQQMSQHMPLESGPAEQMTPPEAGSEAGASSNSATMPVPELAENTANATSDEYDKFLPFYQNPIYMGIAAGGAVLVGLLYLIFRRRDDDDEYDFLESDSDIDMDDDVDLDDDSLGAGSSTSKSGDDEVPLLAIGDDEANSLSASPGFDDEIGNASDVVSEADIFMAYGRFTEAFDLLNKSIQQNPSQTDVYLKLMEVCVETQDADAFLHCEAQLRDRGLYDAHSDRIQALREHFGSDLAKPTKPATPLNVAATEAAESDMVEKATPDTATGAALYDEDFLSEADEQGNDHLAEVPKKSFSSLDTIPDESTEPNGAVEPLRFGLDLNETLERDTGMPSLDDLESSLTADFGEPDMGQNAPPSQSAQFAQTESADDDTLLWQTNGDDLSDDGLLMDTDNLAELDANSLAAELDDVFDASGSIDLNEDSPMMNTRSGPSSEPLTDLQSMDLQLEAGDVQSEFALEPELASAPQQAPEQEPELAESTFLHDDVFSGDLSQDLSDDLSLPSLSINEQQPTSDAPIASIPMTIVDPLTNDDLDSRSSAASVHGQAEQDHAEAEEDFELALHNELMSDADEAATKLDLARAYIDMGDRAGARDILDEVVQEGSIQQQEEAKALLKKVS